jgi:hypothetical protein
MINLGELHFHVGVPNLSKDELESYSSDLFDQWERHLSSTLNLSDFSILLEIEDGSIHGKTKIGAAIAVLYIGIGQYGSFINGLQTIQRQVTSAGDYLSDKVYSDYKSSGSSFKVSKRGGALGQLERLFHSVQKNELSVEDAMEKVDKILGDDAASSPEFISKLKSSLDEIPSLEQLDFEFEELLELDIPEEEPQKPKPSRTPRPTPPPALHNRVEIWRETKSGKKKIKVTQV